MRSFVLSAALLLAGLGQAREMAAGEKVYAELEDEQRINDLTAYLKPFAAQEQQVTL